MSLPRIGVPVMGSSLARKYMQRQYTKCLQAAGARVDLLEPVLQADRVRRYVVQHDAFLFPGGPDIDPHCYGAEPSPACGAPNPVRDGFELPFIRAVLASGKPVLCICRGMQLLNVALGGTLRQDIKPIQKYNHADILHCKTHTHPVVLRRGSFVEQLYRRRVIWVNSLHHQVVDRLGDGLVAVAHSPEGFVEALELPGRPAFTLGVQWHPEHMAPRDPAQQHLFEVFVGACQPKR